MRGGVLLGSQSAGVWGGVTEGVKRFLKDVFTRVSEKRVCAASRLLPGFSAFESLSGNDDVHGELSSASRLPRA